MSEIMGNWDEAGSVMKVIHWEMLIDDYVQKYVANEMYAYFYVKMK